MHCIRHADTSGARARSRFLDSCSWTHAPDLASPATRSNEICCGTQERVPGLRSGAGPALSPVAQRLVTSGWYQPDVAQRRES